MTMALKRLVAFSFGFVGTLVLILWAHHSHADSIRTRNGSYLITNDEIEQRFSKPENKRSRGTTTINTVPRVSSQLEIEKLFQMVAVRERFTSYNNPSEAIHSAILKFERMTKNSSASETLKRQIEVYIKGLREHFVNVTASSCPQYKRCPSDEKERRATVFFNKATSAVDSLLDKNAQTYTEITDANGKTRRVQTSYISTEEWVQGHNRDQYYRFLKLSTDLSLNALVDEYSMISIEDINADSQLIEDARPRARYADEQLGGADSTPESN